MLKILINNLQKKSRFNSKYLRKIVEKSVGIVSPHSAAIEINLVIVDNKYIKNLNRKYRKVNRATDVIAFSMKEGPRWPVFLPCGGDIFVSIEKAKKQAKEFKHSLKKEMTILIIHGVLHLFGYDHIKKKDAVIMEKKGKEILDCLKIT